MTDTELVEKIAKLPKWAQEHITNQNRILQRQEQDYKELQNFFTGQRQTHVKLVRGMRGDKDIYIPDDMGVEFTMKDGSVYEVRFDEGWRGSRALLRVCQNHSFRSSMVVAPSASNVVYIKSVED